MILGLLRQLNWVDFLVIIIFLRIIYIALNSSFPLELFKLLGTFTSLYLSLHYFTFFTDWIGQRAHSARQRIPLGFLDFMAFIAAAIIGYLIFVAIRLLFDRLIKMEMPQTINKIVALCLSVMRVFFLVSLITFALVVSNIGYLKDSVRGSFSGKRMFNAAVNTYSWTWNNLTSKFAVGEKFNRTVIEVQKDLMK